MIPVLACPILNRPDLLTSMLTSIDEPVGRVYVIDNGDVVTDSDGCYVVKPGANLGVAASWNLAIKANIDAPWWLFVNADVIFGPGNLAGLAQEMADPSAKVVCLLGFAAFAVNAAAIDQVGWFDENFAPMYYEDTDWCRRADLVGLPRKHIGAGMIHVDDGEQTIKSAQKYAAERDTLHRHNRQHYALKWGGMHPHEEYGTPFNLGGDPRMWPQPTIERLRRQRWHS